MVLQDERSKKYHIEVTTSKNNKVHKFSEFSLLFLEGKLVEFKDNEAEFEKIRNAYKNRDK